MNVSMNDRLRWLLGRRKKKAQIRRRTRAQWYATAMREYAASAGVPLTKWQLDVMVRSATDHLQ